MANTMWPSVEDGVISNSSTFSTVSNSSFSSTVSRGNPPEGAVTVYPFPDLYNVSDGFTTSTSLDPHNNMTTSSADGVSRNLMVPAIMFFLGVFGNILALVILTVKPSKDSKATAFYHLVKALVYMDLFGIVATSPVTIVVYHNDGIMETGGTALCHYFSFLLMLAGNATVFTVLVMAGERFLVSKYPFQYSRVVRPLVVNLTVAAVWGYSCLVAILPVLGVGSNKAHWPQTWCFFDYRNTDIDGQILSYYYATTGLLAIIITIVLNMTVIRHLWSMRRSRLHSTLRRSSYRSQSGQEISSGGSGPDSELRMVVFLMAIIVVFSVCYAPLMVRIIMNEMLNAGQVIPAGGVQDKLDLWSLRLACLNQILDPWVYIISRVTCCKSQRDSAREPLRSVSQVRSITPASTPTHTRRSTVVSLSGHQGHPALQCPRQQPSLVSRALGTVRVIFKRKKPGKKYSVSSASKESEMTSASPLRSPAPRQISLAESTVSSRCEASSRLYEDGVC